MKKSNSKEDLAIAAVWGVPAGFVGSLLSYAAYLSIQDRQAACSFYPNSSLGLRIILIFTCMTYIAGFGCRIVQKDTIRPVIFSVILTTILTLTGILLTVFLLPFGICSTMEYGSLSLFTDPGQLSQLSLYVIFLALLIFISGMLGGKLAKILLYS